MGYGLSAPFLGHDDYEGVDVTGKIVIVLDGVPGGFPTDVASALGGAGTKAEMADAAGAIGLVSLSSEEMEKRFPMDRFQAFYSRPALRWTQPDGSGFAKYKNLKATARLSADIAGKLAAAAGIDTAAMAEDMKNGVAPKPAVMDATLTLSRKTAFGDGFTSPNVAAVLPGSDPALKDEYVVISAHLDHVGESDHAKGDDKIFNGAMDNASGNAVMLEVARAFAAAEKKPRRSIMFLSVTAEEKGLMGADYFANFPTVPQGSIVANVNLDMPILLYDFKDVVAFGAEHSTLQQIGERAAERAGITFAPDPVPEEGLFTRSDHFRFVQKGIPSIFLMVGFTAQDPEVDGEAIWKGFLRGNETQARNYHMPSDDMNQPFDWNAAERFALVNYLIIEEAANAPEAPKWNADSPFGQYYGK